jgi:hypothetical protein
MTGWTMEHPEGETDMLSGNGGTPPAIIISSKLTIFGRKINAIPLSQTYSLRGQNIQGNITLEASSGWEVSLSPSGGWFTKLILSGNFSGDVNVRLSGSGAGEYRGTLVHMAPGCRNVAVNVFGVIGDGTAKNPYPLIKASDVDDIRNGLSSFYKQYCDISLADYGAGYDHGRGWNPVGNGTQPFRGGLDGGGYQLSDLYVKLPLTQGTRGGLFNYTEGADLRRIKIVNAYLSAESCAPLVGETAVATMVTDCHVLNTSLDVHGASAGLVRVAWVGTKIDLCSAETSSTTNSCAFGGIFNNAEGAVISRSRAVVNIKALNFDHSYSPSGSPWYNADSFCGFGVLAAGCEIYDCYARGKTYGSLWTTGFIQVADFSAENSKDTIVQRCFSAVLLTTFVHPPDDPQKAGFVQERSAGSQIINCHFDKTLAGTPDTAGGKSETTANAKKQSTYTGWDFANIWQINEGVDYPKLRGN